MGDPPKIKQCDSTQVLGGRPHHFPRKCGATFFEECKWGKSRIFQRMKNSFFHEKAHPEGTQTVLVAENE